MNISRVITFLVAGIFIGAILFFAGFGVLNLLKSDSDTLVVVAEEQIETTQPATTPQAVPVNPPKIEVTSSQAGNDNAATPSDLLEGQGTSNSPFRIKPLNNVGSNSSNNPDEAIQTVAFGTLTLSTVSSQNSTPVNADFLIQNSDGMAIALVKDTSTSTLSLPVGDYKITVSQGSEKVVRFLGVKDGRNGSEVFELNVPVLTGEVPAPVIAGADTNTPTPVPPNTVVDSNIATSNQPAATATAQNDSPTEPSVENSTTGATADKVANSGESSSTAAETPADSSGSASAADIATPSQTTASQAITSNSSDSNSSSTAIGGLRLSALTKQGKRPTIVSFYIQRLNGQNVETFRNVKTQQLTLPAGKYRITVKTDKTSQVKQVEVLATKGVHEIFLISDQPDSSQSSTVPAASATQNEQASTTSNSAASTSTASDSSTSEKDSKKATGKLELFAQKASNNSAIKSNFYVQMPNGTMVASKVYVDSIGYRLPAGTYKVIVRANGYKNKSITLNVRAGQTRREIFKLESATPAASQNNASSSTNTRATAPAATQPGTAQQTPPAPARPAQNTARPFGGLTVNIVSESDGAGLAADIVITQRDGTPLKQASGVSSASFDLPPREFLIRVSYGGITTSNPVKIIAGKLAIKTISFDTERLSRQERRRQRRQERRERSQ